MKTVYLVRHAKSSWDNAFTSDFDRPLNQRGRNNAPAMGLFLSRKMPMPHLIISSPANRALSTAQLIAEQWGYDINGIIEQPALYWFDYNVAPIVDIITQIPDHHQSVMLVGHNPTFTHLGNHLLGQHRFDDIPTCAVICLSYDIDNWHNIGSTKPELTFYVYPKLILNDE